MHTIGLGKLIEDASERLGWDYGIVADAVFNLTRQQSMPSDEALEQMIFTMVINECHSEEDWESVCSLLP